MDNRAGYPRASTCPPRSAPRKPSTVLGQPGETKYANYAEQMDKVRRQMKSLPNSQWTENLYWSWLYTFCPLIQPKHPTAATPAS